MKEEVPKGEKAGEAETGEQQEEKAVEDAPKEAESLKRKADAVQTPTKNTSPKKLKSPSGLRVGTRASTTEKGTRPGRNR